MSITSTIVKDHKVFREIVSCSIETLMSTYNMHLEKKTANRINSSFLPFYERTALRVKASITTSEFFNLGVRKAIKPESMVDTCVAYENNDRYKALLGFMYLYKRSPRGVCVHIANFLNINTNYLRQVLSEYVVSSERLLINVAALYGTTYSTLVDIGDFVYKSDIDAHIYTLCDAIDFRSAKIHCIPFYNGLAHVDFSNQHNIATILGLALNIMLGDINNSTNINTTTFKKILNFTKYPGYIPSYNKHLLVADSLGISLFELYSVGLQVMETTNLHLYMVPIDQTLHIKNTHQDYKNKAARTYLDIVTYYTDVSIRSLIVKLANIDFACLSRYECSGKIPSSKVLENISAVFGMSYHDFCNIQDLTKEKKEEVISSLLSKDNIIGNYIANSNREDTHIKQIIRAILTYAITIHRDKVIKQWADKAHLSYSCFYKLKSGTIKVSNKTLTKLADSLCISIDKLMGIGTSIINNDIGLGTKVLDDFLFKLIS